MEDEGQAYVNSSSLCSTCFPFEVWLGMYLQLFVPEPSGFDSTSLSGFQLLAFFDSECTIVL